MLLSRFSQRLVATCAGLLAGLLAGAGPVAAAPADNTWTRLGALPEPLDAPVFALAVDPSANQNLLLGTETGNLYRSTDGGQTWKLSYHSPRAVLAVAFNPYRAGAVLAGTRGGGVLRSTDDGATWMPQPGTENSAPRAFGFSRTAAQAGTDRGVLIGRDNAPAWTPLGLDRLSVNALAVSTAGEPARLVAGGDASRGTEALPLYSSADGGTTWAPIQGISTASTIVAALAAGAPPPKADSRPLVLGTNTALYQSGDSAATWQQVTGGGVLPATDFNAVAFVTSHPDRYYVASDGGASDRGGLWYTGDAGQHFTPLRPPVPAVTALAVSNDEQPTLYMATYRPADHLVVLLSYRDTGGAPQPLAEPLPAVAGAAPVAAGPRLASGDWLVVLLTGPEAPFVALAAGAVLVLLLAAVAYLRRGRGRRF